MFKQKLQRGFTLIELLVVIAIIGILAATVLAALGSARSSGSDASAMGSLNSMKAQGELQYTNLGSYTTICSSASTTALRIAIASSSAATAGYSTVDTGVSDGTHAACHDAQDTWVISTPLKTGGYFCADSTGFSGKRSTQTANGDTACPAS